MIKILLVEDNTLVREGIAELLGEQDDMEVIGNTDNGIKALLLLEQGLRPDILLADMNMPEMDGITLTRQIIMRNLSMVKIIILTMHLNQQFAERAFEAGAKGYLLKNGDFEELYQAIRLVQQNQTYMSAGVLT